MRCSSVGGHAGRREDGGPPPRPPTWRVSFPPCGQLAATNLPAFSRCCRWAHAAALPSVAVIAVATWDGATVEVFRSPEWPPGWTNSGVDLNELRNAAASACRAAAGLRGPGGVASLLRFLRSRGARRLVVQRAANESRPPLPAAALLSFFDTLHTGLRGLTSLCGLVVDAAMVDGLVSGVRFPAALESLSITELRVNHPADRRPPFGGQHPPELRHPRGARKGAGSRRNCRVGRLGFRPRRFGGAVSLR